MRKFFRIILKLYPAEYREAFETEMTGVFEQARAEANKMGILKRLHFFTSETGGLLKGLLTERTAKLMAGDAYVTSRCPAQPQTERPDEVAEAKRHLEYVLRSMEFAIAHHDFPKARFYSNEEYAARARLERLRWIGN